VLEIEPRFLGRPIHNVVSLPNEQSCSQPTSVYFAAKDNAMCNLLQRADVNLTRILHVSTKPGYHQGEHVKHNGEIL